MLQDTQSKILVSDLDDTLISTDLLFEHLLSAIKSNPLVLIMLPLWLAKGKAYLKQQLQTRSNLNHENLPYKKEVIDLIKSYREQGYKTVLATASTQESANAVAEHLGIFDEVHGSRPDYNLKSSNKKETLDKLYGEGNYIYIGDSDADLKVWEGAAGAIIIGRNTAFSRQVAERTSVISEINPPKKPYYKTFIKQIRVYQWVKNILMFLPLLMAHILEIGDFITALWAFFAFSFVASSVYVTNDLLDLDSDRTHTRKKNRPLASGAMPLPHGLILAPLLLVAGFAIAVFVIPKLMFLFVLITYYIITTAYSFFLKKIAIMDIIVLAILYTIRVIAGSAATGVPTSEWLLAFTMFLFTSLAFVKRYTELLQNEKQNKKKVKGRGYDIEDKLLLLGFGPASGYLSVLIFALYVSSPKVKELYSEPVLLWMIAPLLLYFVTRIWLMAHRGKMTDDPIVFTAKDKYSYVIGFFVMLIIVLANVIDIDFFSI
ncbi:MAG: UbiA family prenyltransferase [Candidatus Kapaibacteriales bacterium]